MLSKPLEVGVFLHRDPDGNYEGNPPLLVTLRDSNIWAPCSWTQNTLGA